MVESLAPPVEPGAATGERDEERSALELSLLLAAVTRWSGHDFSEYAPGVLKRRVAERMRGEAVDTISGLQERLLHDRRALDRFVFGMSQNSNHFFREPEYFRCIRERVVPFLRTYSFARLWFPACSTGEDVYTMALILHEEDALERCMIYATDMSEMALDHARAGVYDIGALEHFANDYRMSGGRLSLADLCEYRDGSLRLGEPLRRRIIFSRHNLTTDASLNAFQCILVRGALAQYSKALQYRVHNLLLQSLARFGFLCLSAAESLHATPHEGVFRKVDEAFPIYRRMR